jgi:hypothetical protein
MWLQLFFLRPRHTDGRTVCECVCVSVSVSVCVCECECVCVSVWVCVCECECVCECVSVCVWVCVSVCECECECVSVWVCVCVSVCVWVRSHYNYARYLKFLRTDGKQKLTCKQFLYFIHDKSHTEMFLCQYLCPVMGSKLGNLIPTRLKTLTRK